MGTRVGGLATGIDTDTQVKNMLKGRQAQLDTLKQKQTLIEWRQTDYQTMYSALSNFQKNTLTDFRLDKTLAAKKATSSDDTKVTAAPNSDALAGSHTISVKNLAAGISKVSTAKITSGSDKSTLATQTGLVSDFVMAINGKEFTVSKSWSINDFATVLNAYGGDIKASYDTTTDLFTIATTDQGAYDSKGGARIDFAGSDATAMDFLVNKLHFNLDGYRASKAKVTPLGNDNTKDLVTQFGALNKFDLVINGQTITIDPANASASQPPLTPAATIRTSTMSDVVAEINQAMTNASIKVQASYDTTTDRIFLANTDGTSTTAGTAITFGSAAPANAERYAAGMNFLINNMQLDVPYAVSSSSALANVRKTALGSISQLTGITNPATDTLASVFGLAGTMSIKIGGNAAIVLNATDKIDDSADPANSVVAKLTANGYTASFDNTAKRFYLTNASGDPATIDFNGTDPAGMDLLTGNLQLIAPIKYNVNYKATSIGAMNITLPSGTMAHDLGMDTGTFTIKVNGQSITIDPTQTINTVMSTITGTAGANVKATYDSTAKMVTFERTDGLTTPIDFTGTSGAGMYWLTNNLALSTNSTNSFRSTQTLNSLFGLSAAMNVKIDGQSFTLNPTDTLDDMAANLTANGYTAYVDQQSQRLTVYRNSASASAIDFTGNTPAALDFFTNKLKLIATTKTDVPANRTSGSQLTVSGDPTAVTMDSYLGMDSGAFDISVNDKTVHIDPATMKMADVMTAITNAGAGVSATYSSTSKQVTLSRTDGSSSNIDFAGSSAAGMYWLTNNLKLLYTSPSSYAMRGTDANLTLDNIATTSHSNSYTKDNVTYNLKATTVSGGVDTPVTIGVASDTDTIVANVKKFVESYNALLAQLNTAIDTKRPKQTDKRSYFLPLTDEQKNAMKDDDITTWTKQAKTGLLNNDSILQSAVNALRSDVANPVVRYPTAAMETASTGNNNRTSFTLDFNEPLYKSLGGTPPVYSALPSGTDVTSRFDYTGIATVDKIMYQIISGTPKLVVTFKSPTDSKYNPGDPHAPAGTIWSPQPGDTIKLKSDDNCQLYNSRGAQYLPQAATLTTQLSETDADTKTGNQAVDYVWSYPADSTKTTPQVAANAWMTAAAVGISTDDGSGYLQYKDGGKLYVNETTLKSALEADSNILKNIFGTKSTTSDRQGIAVRMYNDITTQLTTLRKKAGAPGSNLGNSTLDKELTDYATRIYNLEEIMADEETRYYRQFSAMESAIQKLNSQGSWLSQFSGSSSSK